MEKLIFVVLKLKQSWYRKVFYQSDTSKNNIIKYYSFNLSTRKTNLAIKNSRGNFC